MSLSHYPQRLLRSRTPDTHSRSLKVIAFGALTALLPLSKGVAQDSHLSLKMSAITLGTQNPAAGQYPMDSSQNTIVTIPPQCTGAKRCPLLVQMPGGGQPASVMTGWMGAVANKYGFILMAVSEESYNAPFLDTALTAVLKRFAIDTSKIAIAGRCASGDAGMTYGIQNLNIFNRIISVSGGVPVEAMDPKNTTAAFLIDRGFHEVPDNFEAAQKLRTGNHPITVALGLREHEHQGEDYDFIGHWLMDSWSGHPSAPPAAGTLVALTPDAITKMTAFWTSFAKEPDSIRLTARRHYLHEVAIPVGTEQPLVWMTDMSAFSAKYPTVAADFKSAGLTPQDHDAYRVALLSALVGGASGTSIGTVDATSTLGKNIAFLSAHPDEVGKLETAGIDDPSKSDGIGGCCTDPDQVDHMGPLGIWRTP